MQEKLDHKNNKESLSEEPLFAIGSTWLIALRTAMASVGLLSSSIALTKADAESIQDTKLLFIFFAILFLANAVLSMWTKYRKPNHRFLFLQIFFDCFVIGGVLLITGAAVSPFVYLFLPLQTIATVFLRRFSSQFLLLLSLSIYGIVLFASTSVWGVLPFQENIPRLKFSRLLIHWSSLAIALSLVYIALNKIRDSLLTSLKAPQFKSTLRAHSSQQMNSLIENLPEAIIAVNDSGKIKGINSAAHTLFGSSVKDLKGAQLSSFSKFLVDKCNLIKPLEEYSTWDEFSLLNPENTDEKIRIILHKRTPDNESSCGFNGTFYLFQNVTALRTIEEKLQLQERMAKALSDSSTEHTPPLNFSGFIGESPKMKDLFSLIHKASETTSTVLITGESGTGKELVAKAIHLQGESSTGPFIPVNCGAIPENLIESQLFGHMKGAFTGAYDDHTGFFKQADGGTLFLDEIGEMPLQMQVKLLRSLQERSIQPIGGEEQISFNARIIAATNVNLREAITKNEFREDLYYRLNVVNLELPPLRERKEDIPLLIESFIKRLKSSENLPLIPSTTLDLLMQYEYPGNIRELENILEGALVISTDVLTPESLPQHVRESDTQRNNTEIIINEDLEFPFELDSMLQSLEQHYLKLALDQSNGKKKAAAELLGLNFRTFRYRLQKFNL